MLPTTQTTLRRLQAALDPSRLFRRCVGSPPDPWQQQLLRSTAPQVLLDCSRQSGKSQTCAVLAMHQALYVPGSLTLLLAPSQRQAQELFRKVKQCAAALRVPVHETLRETSLAIELASGGRVEALPGKEQTIRGYSAVSLLVIDEAARVPDNLYHSLRPMLAVSQGRLIALSTPFGDRGWWYEAWRSDEPWERYEVPATMCPRISAAFLEGERRALGDWWYSQEYMCQFRSATDQIFSSADIEAAIDPTIEPLEW